jgi:hypothetical protein
MGQFRILARIIMKAVQWGWLQTESILQLQHAKWMEQKAIFSMTLLCSKVSQNQAMMFAGLY